MVRKNNMLHKSAFSIIELIFAIVIIAITVMSLPMMTQVTSSGIEKNLVQEAIFAASAELNQAVSYRWDKNSAENSNSSLSKVINIGSNCDATTKQRPGQVNRRCLNDLTVTTAFGASDTAIPNLNNAAHASSTIFIGTANTAAGYKKDYNSIVTVNNSATFGALNNDPNIKKITVTITDTSGNTVTQLNSYSTNIGEIDYYKRMYL